MNGWRYEWVEELDPYVKEILIEEMIKTAEEQSE